MTIEEKLIKSKDGLNTLLAYANGVTGQTDTNIKDAVKTLCDGFGGGSNVATGKFVVGSAGYLTIDTGLTDVSYFLLINISTSSFSAVARQLYIRYANFEKDIYINVLGTSNPGETTINAYRGKSCTLNGGTITLSTGAATIGTFRPGDNFVWFAW